jgi:hypothetical protein
MSVKLACKYTLLAILIINAKIFRISAINPVEFSLTMLPTVYFIQIDHMFRLPALVVNRMGLL